MRWLRRFAVPRALVRNTGVMYGAAVLAGASQYVLLVILARTLGSSSLGYVILCTTVANFIAAAVELGLIPVLVRYRPALQEQDPSLWAAVVRLVVGLLARALTGVVLLAIVIAASLAVVGWHTAMVGALVVGVAIGLPIAVLTLFQGYLQAESRFYTIAIVGVGLALVRLAAVVSLFLVAQSVSVNSVLAIYFLTAVVAALVTWRVSIAKVRLRHIHDEDRRRARRLIRPYLRWSMLGRASTALNGRLDIFLLSALTNSATVAVYGAAAQSAAPLAMLATAVGEASFPRLASRDQDRATGPLIRWWARWLPLLIVGCGAVGIAGALVLPLIFGSDFQKSAGVFFVLAMSYGLQIWLQPIGALLYASGRQRSAAGVAAVQTIVLAGLDLALIPVFGALGAALAIAATGIVTAPLMLRAALHGHPDTADSMPVAPNA